MCVNKIYRSKAFKQLSYRAEHAFTLESAYGYCVYIISHVHVEENEYPHAQVKVGSSV